MAEMAESVDGGETMGETESDLSMDSSYESCESLPEEENASNTSPEVHNVSELNLLDLCVKNIDFLLEL